MTAFTWLGIPILYLAVVPALHWSVNSRTGVRVALFLLSGGLLNDAGKIAL